jgi:alpha-tubulin suppressor-like RCC1 family protein
MKSIHCRSLPGVLPTSNPSADGVTGVLLALCLWLMLAVLPANAASPGTVVAWGYNGRGQTNVPAGLSGVTAIAAGYQFTVALKMDASVVAWGNNYSGETNIPAGLSGVTAISAGNNHIVALVTNGMVVAWGDNDSGQTNGPVGLSGVTAIAAGGNHTVALKGDGTVVAWGYNYYGQTAVPAGLSGVAAIAAGVSHTVVLKTNGTVVAWGDNTYGQTNVPAGLSGVMAIAAGGYITVALKTNGTVVAWGYNYYGQTAVPAGLSGVTAISVGGYHTVALKTNGTVVAWGAIGLDNGQTTIPAGLSGVTAIAAGGLHTVAVVAVPIITAQPQSLVVNAGSNAIFSVTATNTASSSYQWYYNTNTALTSGTNATLLLSNVQTNQAGNYTVVITNAYGSVTSSVAVLTVFVPTVQFAANPTFGGVPLTVQFTSPSIDSGSYTITNWNWNFGDGSTSTAQNPSHIYTAVGSFSPSLIATNIYGGQVVGSGPSITVLYLLLNGGFETGDFSGWTGSGNFTSCSVVTGSLYAHSGTYGAQRGPSTSLGYLSQRLPTASNGVYTLSFWLDSPDGLTPNEFSVVWDGTTLLDKKSWSAIGWTNIQFVVTASGTNTLLQFGFRDDNSFLGLDDISVTPPAPLVIAGIHLSGTNLVLNGSSGLSGLTYYTQVSTNLIQWVTVATNVLGANGNFTITATNDSPSLEGPGWGMGVQTNFSVSFTASIGLRLGPSVFWGKRYLKHYDLPAYYQRDEASQNTNSASRR